MTPTQRAKILAATFPFIHGSRFRRAFCGSCKEAIRIDFDTAREFVGRPQDLTCERCDGNRPPSKASVITPRQRHKLA